MPKVSIIIPVYNVEKYLKQCLDSVVNQTMQDIEIICVNDCSTDNSLCILKEYAKKDSRIVIIDKDINEGLGCTRNVGQKHATGKYIMFLDSDDYIALDACEKLYNKIETDNVDVVFFNADRFYDGKNKFSPKINMELTLKDAYTSETFYAKDKYQYLLNQSREVWFKIYNKKFLDDNHITSSEHRLCEDTLFRLDLLLANPKCSILNDTLLYYRLRKGSLARSNHDKSKSDIIFDINKKCIDKILKFSFSEDEKLLFIKNQVRWLNIWTDTKVSDKKLKKRNLKKRRNEYKYFLFNFSLRKIMNLMYDTSFWRDISKIGNELFYIYYDYSKGYLQYRIKILCFKITIN